MGARRFFHFFAPIFSIINAAAPQNSGAQASAGAAATEALRHNFISCLILAAQNGFGRDVEPFLALCHETWGEEVLWDAVKDLPHGSGRRTRLMYAARAGDVTRLRWLLARGARAELADAAGRTALHWASAAGRAGAVKELLLPPQLQSPRRASSVSVDAACGDGTTPLLAACRRGHAGAARELLARGADAARGGLRFALADGHEDAALALLEGGAPCAPRELPGLLFSVRGGGASPALLAALCARAGLAGAPLGAALAAAAAPIAAHPWAAGAVLNPLVPVPPGATLAAIVAAWPPLAGAAGVLAAACLRCGEAGSAEVLLAAARAGALDAPLLPAPPHQKGAGAAARVTPLARALSEGRPDIAAAIVRAGAAVGEAALSAAARARAGAAALVEALLLTPTQGSGLSLAAAAAAAGGGPLLRAQLLAAARAGSHRALRALLWGCAEEGEGAGGGEGAEEEEEGGAWAGEEGAAARALLRAAADELGYSALMLAAAGAHTRAAALLLRAGAPAVARAGATSALALAAGAGDAETVRALLAAGAGARGGGGEGGEGGAADGADAALRAAAGGHHAALSLLLSFDAALALARDGACAGRTPLHWAASGGHARAAAALLAAGARAGAVAHGAPGKTPADVAEEAGHGELAATLRRAAAAAAAPR